MVETHRRAQAVTQGAVEQLTLEEFACLRWAGGLGDFFVDECVVSVCVCKDDCLFYSRVGV